MRRQEQGSKALISLRDAILSGELPAGERLLELALVDRLKISRTPIRFALERLADEGLIEKRGGGYVVRAFTSLEIRDAIRVRGVLEGMAVRMAAERDAPDPQALAVARQCIVDLDKVLSARRPIAAHVEEYLDINRRFHESIMLMSDSFVVQRTLQHACALPFASPNAFVMARRELGDIREVMVISQSQHRSILEAIENREGARAEAIAREHAELSLNALKRVLESEPRQDEAIAPIEFLKTV